MLPTSLQEINEYLFYEFGKDLEEDESKISQNWPFVLKDKGSFHANEREFYVYEFSDEDDEYYVIDGESLTYVDKSDLSLEELRLEQIGYCWIKRREPIDIDTVILGEEKIPGTTQRKNEIEMLAKEAIGGEEKFSILEGLYLKDNGSYLAIVERKSDKQADIIGTEIKAEPAPCSKASAYRRLAIAIGAMVETNRL